MKTKKITLATVKSMIRKNSANGNIFIKVSSSFDGMIDGCRYYADAKFEKADIDTYHPEHSLGIAGAWFVGQSRDYFTPIENDDMFCIKVSNSCGSFTLGFKK